MTSVTWHIETMGLVLVVVMVGRGTQKPVRGRRVTVSGVRDRIFFLEENDDEWLWSAIGNHESKYCWEVL